MQKDGKLFDDMARMGTGAAGLFLDMKREIEAQMRAQVEKYMRGMEWVSREEFEVVKEMAAKARTEQEVLATRLAELEKTLTNQKPNKK